MALTSVVLRNEKHDKDSRYLAASFNTSGDLVIEGQDLGPQVQAIFGSLEYEWSWIIRADTLPALKQALEYPVDLLESLRIRFSHENAAHLITFLIENKIVFETWSRIGD